MKDNHGSKASRLGHVVSIMPLPILVILAVTLQVLGVGNSPVFDPPGLLPVLNLLFLCIGPMVVGYLAARGYLSDGSAGLAAMGGGAFSLAVGSLLAGFFFQTRGPNANITIYNVSAFLAGALHLAGAISILVRSPPEEDARKRRYKLITLFVGASAVLAVVTFGIHGDLWPAFFIQGRGPTPVRQFVLGAALLSFLLSGLLFALFYRASRNRFLYWYGLALSLITVGLGCIFIQKSFGGPIGWLGRTAQYLGGLYLVIAVLRGAKEAKVSPTQLDAVFMKLFSNRFEFLLAERTGELAEANESLRQEVTDRRQAEEELRASQRSLATAEERYRTIADFTYDWETWEGPGGEMYYVSPSCMRISGYSEKEFVDDPSLLREIIEPGDRAVWDEHLGLRHEEDVHERGSVVEFRIRCKDGSVRWIQHKCQPVTGEDGIFRGIRGSNRDVTLHKQLEQESSRQQAELVHISRVAAVNELTASIAHELNQPLAAILCNAQAAKRFLAQSPPDMGEVSSAIEDIVADERRADQVIKRLRRLLKRDESVLEELDVNEVVSEALAVLASQAANSDVLVGLNEEKGLPKVLGDRIQLEQVVLNLVVNAIDALEEVVGPERRVTITTSRSDATLRIEVQDNGPGLQPQLGEEVFKPFVTTKDGGLGIGLSICRTILEAHGGNLAGETRAEGGALFTVTLPIAQDDLR